MIGFRELRIGNWINEQGLILQVGMINQSLFEGSDPIPISEEWHNKFGVTKNGFNAFVYKIRLGKFISFSGDYIYLIDTVRMDEVMTPDDDICTLWNNDVRGRAIYVHEWQNLYFVIKGDELEINI